MSFANMKRQGSSNLDKLKSAAESINSSAPDNSNVWKPEVDKAGNGLATIRFLPSPEVDGDEGLPWVKLFNHGFQIDGKWFIDNCPTTKGKDCPVCEENGKLWNSGIEANKDVARDRKRKLTYIANIYVVSDPKRPENEGKVFLFKFGKKIFDKISEAMNPPFADKEAINPFDLWTGANFKLRIRKVAGYQNYDSSEFESPSVLGDFSDAELEAIYKQEYSLQEHVADSEFKTYDQLKSRLDKVLGVESEKPRSTVEQIKSQASKLAKTEEEDSPYEETPNLDTATLEEDDDLAYFSRLANED